MRIFIDADACPVKDEVYKVAGRYGLMDMQLSEAAVEVGAAQGQRILARRQPGCGFHAATVPHWAAPRQVEPIANWAYADCAIRVIVFR